MESSSLAKTYARAFYALVAKDYESNRDMLSYVSAAINAVGDAKRFLGHPSFSDPDKLKFIAGISGRKLSQPAERLFLTLIEKKRLSLLDLILVELEKIYSQKHNFKFIQVVSASELTAEQRKRIAESIAVWAETKVEVEFDIDPTKIAGFVIKDGENVLDNTLVSELRIIRENLLNA
jgi:F-type H+-transporting ATPase subunit delta